MIILRATLSPLFTLAFYQGVSSLHQADSEFFSGGSAARKEPRGRYYANDQSIGQAIKT